MPEKVTQNYRTSQINSCDETNVQLCKDSRIIHHVILHKRNHILVHTVRGTVSITRQVTCTWICLITSQEQVMKTALHKVDAI